MDIYGVVCGECGWLVNSVTKEEQKKTIEKHHVKNPTHFIIPMEKEPIWDQCKQLACPNLRYHDIFGWVAIKTDPCPDKTCGQEGCHNYGSQYSGRQKLTFIDSIHACDIIDDHAHPPHAINGCVG